MCSTLYNKLQQISEENENIKIVVGKQVVKRFAHLWNCGEEQYATLKKVGTFDDTVIKVEETCNYDMVKHAILEINGVEE